MSDWISIKDQMPELGSRTLVSDGIITSIISWDVDTLYLYSEFAGILYE